MLTVDLRTRHRSEEWMDRPDVDTADLERSLRFIRRINRFLGYTRATIGHLERFSRNWDRRETIRIVDFATGSADIPRAILRWASHCGFDVRIVGVDRHPLTAHLAASDGPADPRLTIIRGDARQTPFDDQSFDYALTAMFLHHLSEDEAVCVLREMNRVSRRGIIAADLIRHRRAYAWIKLLTSLSDQMIRHDARVSVMQAFTNTEVLQMCRRASIEYATYHKHFGYRFVIAGQKNGVFPVSSARAFDS